MKKKSQKFTSAEKKEINRLFWQLTTKQLWAHINAQRSGNNQLGYTTFRTMLYKMGLKKCSILRWAQQETQFLLDNYKTMGNIEIAERLTTKRRPFHKKNVEKKMKLLGIKRTREEITGIIAKYKERGVYSRANYKRWDGIRIEEGQTKVQIRNGKPIVMVKANGVLTPYARHRYLQLHGSIPNGYKVYFKDLNPLNIADANLIAEPAHGYTIEQKAIYNKHVYNYFSSLKFKQNLKAKKEQINKAKKRLASIPVRVDSRTTIYVKPGTNISAFIEKYKQSRAIV